MNRELTGLYYRVQRDGYDDDEAVYDEWVCTCFGERDQKRCL